MRRPGNGAKGWLAYVVTAAGEELEFPVPYGERASFTERMVSDGARSIRAIKDTDAYSRRWETWL